MDLGIFDRTRTRRMLWLALPPLAALLVYTASAAVATRAEHVLLRARTLSRLVPFMEHSRKDAEAALARFEPAGSIDDAQRDLDIRVNELASRFGIILHSLKIMPPGEAGHDGKSAASIGVNIEAPLRSIVDFANELQQESLLLTMDAVQLSITGARTNDASYRLDLMMTVHKRDAL